VTRCKRRRRLVRHRPERANAARCSYGHLGRSASARCAILHREQLVIGSTPGVSDKPKDVIHQQVDSARKLRRISCSPHSAVVHTRICTSGRLPPRSFVNVAGFANSITWRTSTSASWSCSPARTCRAAAGIRISERGGVLGGANSRIPVSSSRHARTKAFWKHPGRDGHLASGDISVSVRMRVDFLPCRPFHLAGYDACELFTSATWWSHPLGYRQVRGVFNVGAPIPCRLAHHQVLDRPSIRPFPSAAPCQALWSLRLTHFQHRSSTNRTCACRRPPRPRNPGLPRVALHHRIVGRSTRNPVITLQRLRSARLIQPRTMDLRPIVSVILWPTWGQNSRRRPPRPLRFLKRPKWVVDDSRRFKSGALASFATAVAVPFFGRASRGWADRAISPPEDSTRSFSRREATAKTARCASDGPPSSVRKNNRGTTGQPLLFGYTPTANTGDRPVKPRVRCRISTGGPHVTLGAPPLASGRVAVRPGLLDRFMRREKYVRAAVMTERSARGGRHAAANAKNIRVLHAGGASWRDLNRHELRTWEPYPCLRRRKASTPRRAESNAPSAGFSEPTVPEVMLSLRVRGPRGIHVHENMWSRSWSPRRWASGPAREARWRSRVTDLHNWNAFIRYRNGDWPFKVRGGLSVGGICRIAKVEGARRFVHGADAPSSAAWRSTVFSPVCKRRRQFSRQHRDGSVTCASSRAEHERRLAGEHPSVRAILQRAPVRIEMPRDPPDQKGNGHGHLEA